ncbi:MAG: Rossmann-like and DUF2520 domain-containing protein [Acidimicrobiales bacterium]
MSRRFSLVGPGRAGRSISAALESTGWERRATFGRNDDPRHAAADVDVCIVATPDDAIAATAAAIAPGPAVLVHLSGATPVSALEPHRAAAIHPLVSLADPSRGAEQLGEAWFGVGGDPVATEMAELLSGRWFEIADDDRTLYHAAAAVASNHLVALLGQAERIAAEVGIPFDALLDLVDGTVGNVRSFGPRRALTGPAARGDLDTIERHRAALAARLPNELAAYDALVTEARRLAAEAD